MEWDPATGEMVATTVDIEMGEAQAWLAGSHAWSRKGFGGCVARAFEYLCNSTYGKTIEEL